MSRNRASAKAAGTRMEFTVPGPPISQGSKNAYVVGGRKNPNARNRVVLVETRHDEIQGYRARVALAARHLGRPMLDQPLAIYVAFVLPRPKRPKFDLPATPPDIDKYLRAIFDALTGAGVWVDDARAVKVTTVKRYAVGEEPHTYVMVSPAREEQS